MDSDAPNAPGMMATMHSNARRRRRESSLHILDMLALCKKWFQWSPSTLSPHQLHAQEARDMSRKLHGKAKSDS